MKASEFFDLDKHFRSKDKIRSTIKLAKEYDSDTEDYTTADLLLLFSTTKQKRERIR